MQIKSVESFRKASAKKLKIYGALFVAVVIGFAIFNYRYAYNCYSGPFQLNAEDLRPLKKASHSWKYFVTLTGSQPAVLTPYTMNSIRKNKYTGKVKSVTVTDYFLLLPLPDNALMLVKSPYEKTSTSYTGKLVDMDEEIKNNLTKELEGVRPGISKYILPVMLEETGSFKGALYLLFIVIALFLGFAFLVFWKSATLSKEVTNSILAKELAAEGNPRDLILQIDQELLASGIQETDAGTVAVLKDRILYEKDYDLATIKYSDLVWVYGFETSKYKALILCTKDKKKITLIDKNVNNINLAVHAISSKAPWILSGYSGKMDLSWQAKPNDLIQEVESKEKEFKRS